MKSGIWPVLLVIGVITLNACSSGSSLPPGQCRSGDEAIVGHGGEIVMVNPHLFSADGATAMYLCTSGVWAERK